MSIITSTKSLGHVWHKVQINVWRVLGITGEGWSQSERQPFGAIRNVLGYNKVSEGRNVCRESLESLSRLKLNRGRGSRERKFGLN